MLLPCKLGRHHQTACCTFMLLLSTQASHRMATRFAGPSIQQVLKEMVVHCMQVAEQLHRLAVLSATHHRIPLFAPMAAAGPGLGWWGWASADAHLPLHAAAAQRAVNLLAVSEEGDDWSTGTTTCP